MEADALWLYSEKTAAAEGTDRLKTVAGIENWLKNLLRKILVI
jgi:hypothetical protein